MCVPDEQVRTFYMEECMESEAEKERWKLQRKKQSIRQSIVSAQHRLSAAVNSTMVITYWEIGEQIYKACGENDRAAYGKNLLDYLSAQLTAEFGTGIDWPPSAFSSGTGARIFFCSTAKAVYAGWTGFFHRLSILQLHFEMLCSDWFEDGETDPSGSGTNADVCELLHSWNDEWGRFTAYRYCPLCRQRRLHYKVHAAGR